MPGTLRDDRPAPPSAGSTPQDDAVDAVDLLIVLGRYRRMLVLWPLVAGTVAAGVGLVLPKSYTGSTSILPPQQAQSGVAAALSQLGGLAGAAGGALGMKNPSDLYLAMLQSKTVADALVERFRLREVYGQDFLVDARRTLAGKSRFQVDKSGVIAIEVDAGEPQLAADLANAYVEELHKLTSTLAVTEAAQRRVFFERHLQQAKETLADAEVRLRQAIEAGGLVSVDAQSRATVETVSRLRAQISAKEIQIGAMRAYATASNPDMRRAEQELSSMRQELGRLETGMGSWETPDPAPPVGKAGGSGVGNIRLVREVKYQEVMFELLAKQYEIARVDESKEAPLVQVMDRATPPERRSRPKRTRLVLAAAAVAFLAAVVAAYVRDAAAAAGADPARGDKLAALRAVWRWRRG
jgi:tyrosine-protein kinase Etk/Wzc